MLDAIRHRDLLHRLQSFETLTDAGVYVLARPTGGQDHNAWQSAANIEAATAAPPTAATCLCSIYRRCMDFRLSLNGFRVFLQRLSSQSPI
jgi:hypothetical protein